MRLFKKISLFLSARQKWRLIFIAGLLLVSMVLEIMGLGLILPALSMMLDSDIGKTYPFLKPFLEAVGNPSQAKLVLGCMLTLVIFYCFKSAFLLYVGWKQARFSSELSTELSCDLFLGYLRLPYTFHLQRNSAKLISNIQNEVNIFISVSQSAIDVATEFSIILASVFVLIIAEPVGAVTVAFLLAASAFCFHRLTRQKLFNLGAQRLVHSTLVNQYLFQGLGGVKEVKLMGRENHFLSKYEEHISKYGKIVSQQATLKVIPRLYLELLGVIGLAVLITLMIAQSKPLNLVLPTLGIFVAAAFRMIPSTNRIMGAVQNLRYSQPAIDVLYHEFCLIRDTTSPKTISQRALPFSKEIRIDGLSYRYPTGNNNALEDVSIIIKKGESVGFVGRSGSGKSTLIDAILGLLPPVKGCVKIDGADIQQNMRAWQDQIGYVPQSIYLTDDTIKRNVAFGLPNEEIDSGAVVRSLKAAQLDDFVVSLPDGLETIVGERGIRLSGGQRQRIGIARALYNNPSVLVFDEATSALDTATERGVMQTINALHGIKTVLIVAHRLTTLDKCDRIFCLEHGRIVSEEKRKLEISQPMIEAVI